MTASPATGQTIQLKHTGPEIPPLGVGTWSWGDSLFWQYGKDYGVDDVQQAFTASLAAGVTFLEAPRVEPYGTVAVWRDIFGNTWDLLQRA